MKQYDDMGFITGILSADSKNMIYHKECEPCVHSNNVATWKEFFSKNNVNVVIHNAATVGTDVVALDSTGSTLTNVRYL